MTVGWQRSTACYHTAITSVTLYGRGRFIVFQYRHGIFLVPGLRLIRVGRRRPRRRRRDVDDDLNSNFISQSRFPADAEILMATERRFFAVLPLMDGVRNEDLAFILLRPDLGFTAVVNGQ